MKKVVMLATFLALMFLVDPAPTVSAAGLPLLSIGDKQSDHMLLDGSVPEHGYCGVGTKVEPWELHVAYSPGGSAGTLTIGFRDGSSIPFPVAANSSFSLTQAMGGVPGVDDLVRIDITGGGAWVSARARSGARDPFVEPVAEKDNFCINIPAEQTTNTVGVTLPLVPPFAPRLPVAWDGGDGLLD